MTIITEEWLLEVAKSLKAPSLSPVVVNALLPAIELQIRRVIQEANKFQRRAKSNLLKVSDINLVLSCHHLEPVYGLHVSEALHEWSSPSSEEKSRSAVVSLVDFAKFSMPSCPIKPQLSLHWLAVHGTQPSIPENPRIVPSDALEKLPSTIPKDLQILYARIIRILLTSDHAGGSGGVSSSSQSSALASVCSILQSDTAIQDLVPYFSRFVYHQIKQHVKDLHITRVMIRVVKALDSNATVSLEHHLQQLLPAIFTCVLSAKLSHAAHEDHWSLRDDASAVVAGLHRKYSVKVSDLLTRIVKTYVEAFSLGKSFGTVYGGIVGLKALGVNVIQSILLEQLDKLYVHFERHLAPSSSSRCVKSIAQIEETFAVDMCLDALRQAIGMYIVHSMQSVDVPWLQINQTKVQQKNFNLCDLEESLVPFYMVHSKQLPFCRHYF